MLLFKGAILVIALAVLVGWFHQHLEEFFRWALSLVQEPFHLLSEGLAAVMTSLRNWIRAQMGHDTAAPQQASQPSESSSSDAPATAWNPLAAQQSTPAAHTATAEEAAPAAARGGALSPRQHLQYIIGSILYTAAFLAFVYADFWLIVLTLQAFGLETIATKIPASAALLSAAAFIGVAVFWGLVLLDLLGVTHLAPWERLGTGARRKMVRLAWACITLSLVLCLLFGIWRGSASGSSVTTQMTAVPAVAGGGIEVPSPGRDVGQPSGTESPDPAGGVVPGADSEASEIERLIPKVSMGLLPVLVTISGVWSGMGVATLFQYLVVILAGLMLVPLALLNVSMRIVMGLCTSAFGAIQAILRLLHSMGRGLIEFMRPVYNWLQARMRRSLGEGGSSAALPLAQAGVDEPLISKPDAPAPDSPEHSHTDQPEETDESDESTTAWNPFAMAGGAR